MTADQHLRRWNTGGWLVLAALILVAAGAFVGLLVYDRYLFLVAVGTIGTNAVTWRAGRAAMAAELREARERIEAVPIASRPAALPRERRPMPRPNPRMWDPTSGGAA